MESQQQPEVVEEELNEEGVKALELCLEINTELEAAEANDSASDDFLEKILGRFKSALDLDPECLEAHIGIVYVCGLLGLYEEGLDELRVIEELDLEDERLPEMNEKLKLMKAEAEEEEAEEAEGEEEVEEEATQETDEKGSSGADPDAPTVEKLIINGKVQPKFLEALTEVFQRFDKNNDKALDDKELNAFHLVTNGSPMDPSTLRFLRQHFECDKNRSLTLTGFLNFYISQTLGDVNETWKDLKSLGYDGDLNRISK